MARKSLSNPPAGSLPDGERAARDLPLALRLRLRATWGGLLLERLTAAFWPALALLLLALAVALLGLPQALPGWAHLGLLALFALAFLWLLWRGARRLAWPARRLAQDRVEQASGLEHRPLTAALDSLPRQVRDPQAALLFRLHRARARAQLGRLRAAPPRPVVAGRDPLALGAGAALLLLVGLVVAGGDWQRRLVAAATPSLDGSIAGVATLDAWLDPPDYTGLAPLFLGPQAAGTAIAVPAGSQLLAQVQGGGAAPSLLLDEAATAFTETSPGLWKAELTLQAGERLVIAQGGDELGAWTLQVVPDQAPTAAFREPPAPTERQALALNYEAADDYGLADVKLEIRRADAPEQPPLTLDLAEIDGARRATAGKTYRDLTDNLWAGFAVELTLVATDELGQEGRGAVVRMVLPERNFLHPVARALVELRRRLTVQPEERLAIVRALEDLFNLPRDYGHDSVVAVGMAMAASRLLYERADTAVPEVQSLLWDLALRLEDGDVSLMARQLRDIQERLKEALENGASDEELEALMDELEQAMQEYLEALAEEMQRRIEQGAELVPLPEGSEMIQGSDLQEMLDQMRELSQSGAREQAKQMLEQLQQMLENLQANPMAMMQNEAMQQALDMMRDMEDLLKQQQELLDQSHQEAQKGEQGHNQPQTGSDQPGEKPMQGQADKQEELRRRLGEMMRDMANQLGDIPENMGNAEQSMREATGELQEGDAEGAIGPQTEAIDQLQQGLQEMTQMLLDQFGPVPGLGQGRTGVRPGESRDPLGRRSGDGATDAVDRIDIPEASDLNRSREILEELRRRLADPERPVLERDYIDRLLEQF
jgi:uncharacterized protein (TIGR02302 family)